MPANARSATSGGVPSSMMVLTSPRKRPNNRLTMNEGESWTRIAVFRNDLAAPNAVARVASSVLLALPDLQAVASRRPG